MLILPNWRHEKPSLKDIAKLTIFTIVLFSIGLLCFRSLQNKNNIAKPEKPIKIYKVMELDATPATKPITQPTAQSPQTEPATAKSESSATTQSSSEKQLSRTSNTGITYVPIADAVFDELAEADAKSAQLVELYNQRVDQYLSDREQWNIKFRQAHNDRLSAGKMLIDIIPDGSAEDISNYFNNLSDEQRKQLERKLNELVKNRDALDKRLNSLKKEEPKFPSYTDLEKQYLE